MSYKALFLLFLFSIQICAAEKTTTHLPTIKQIILNSKNCMDLDEFSYLTDLYVGKACTEDQLIKAKEILEIKKRFKKIFLEKSIDPTTKNLILTCTLEPTIVIKKIKIKGGMHNKAHYEHLYQLQQGEIFSPTNHQASLKAIKNRLAQDGCLQGSIKSTVQIDEKTKTASINIALDPGPRFFITNINLALQLPQIANKQHTAKLITHALQGTFNPFIRRYQYSQDRVKRWARTIKQKITDLGYLKPKITPKIKVNHTTRNVTVLFSVTTTTPQYIVTGNKHATKKELFTSFATHVVPYKKLQPSVIKHQIKLHYQTKGYWKPSIHIASSSDNTAITINEGLPLTISQLIIRSPTHKEIPFPTNILTKYAKNTRCTSSFIKNKLQRITQNAIKLGFWDCKIKNTKLLISKKDPSMCILDIVIEPGLQRFLTQLNVKETHPLAKEILKNLPENLDGKPFDPQMITNLRKNILSNLYQKGYWYSSLDCSLKIETVNQETNRLHIAMNCSIDPGEQVIFGKLITQGYSKLPFKHILKNCNLIEGSPWDQKKIDSARSHLHNLEIFDHIKLTPHQLTTPRGYKHVIANILDDDLYEARIKAGFFASNDKPFLQGSHTLKLAGTYRVKNPLNKADMLSISAQADSTEQQIAMQYNIPDLFGKNQINSFTLSTENHRYMLNLTEPIETIIERRTSFTIASRPPTILNKAQLGWTAGIDHSKLLGHHGNMNLDTFLTEKSLFFIYAEPTFKKISLDERKAMAEGSTTEAAAKFIFPFVLYGNAPSVRLCFKQRIAKNLHKNLGIIITLRCGHIFSDNTFSSIHPSDRFYLGGADSIRGYSRDTLPPLGMYTTASGATGYTVQGGKSMLQINFELRQRISKNTEFQLFHDLGSLTQNTAQNLFQQCYQTVGAGTRIYTPVGIVKFDIGYKLSLSYPTENLYNWHLSFDGSF